MGNDKYKKEVFHIYGNYTYSQALEVANILKCELASWSQMKRAYDKGANWCDYGWSKNQEAYFPIQQSYYNSLKNKATNCGNPGLNGGYFSNEFKIRNKLLWIQNKCN